MSALESVTDEGQSSRRCIVSGKTMPMDSLMRFVVGPSKSVVPDVRGVLGGRGIWVGVGRHAIEAAMRQNLFQRAARSNVTVPEDLAQCVESQLVDRVIGALSLARKAGQAVAGFEKVSASVKNGQCVLLVIARDAADNALKKMNALATGVDILECLDAEELGNVFGRERSVHVAVAAGGLAARLKIDGRRLAEFRGKSLDEVGHDAE
jgi:uncharacterized protein